MKNRLQNLIRLAAQFLKNALSGRSSQGASLSNSTLLTVDAQFTPAQTQEINSAMGIIFMLFGGADGFFARTGIPNIHFKCAAQLSCAGSNAVSCYVGNGVIEMSLGAFNPAPLVTGWYVAHEVGHAFDFSRCGGNPGRYRSQAFVEQFVPKTWWRRLLGLPAGRSETFPLRAHPIGAGSATLPRPQPAQEESDEDPHHDCRPCPGRRERRRLRHALPDGHESDRRRPREEAAAQRRPARRRSRSTAPTERRCTKPASTRSRSTPWPRPRPF